MLLHDPGRLLRLLSNRERPVQLVIAGKAHPADQAGQEMIKAWIQFTRRPEVQGRVIFLPDYDLLAAEHLVQGVDLWINTPRRPWEASGTSGMKVLVNGGLNLSVLDGWWDEWFDGGNGWAIPTADGITDEDRRDQLEAAALYDLLEHQVAPRFYDQGARGLPQRWIEMVRHTLTTLGPKVLAGRMVREYVTRLYAPAARSHRAIQGPAAVELAEWKRRLRRQWPQVSVDHVETDSVEGTPQLGSTLTLRTRIALGGLDPADVDVQLVSGRVDAADRMADPALVSLKPAGRPDMSGRQTYEGPLTLDRTGSFGYTVRVLPSHPLLAGPAELGLVALPADSAGMTAGMLR
jgi:starch phosphorylase